MIVGLAMPAAPKPMIRPILVTIAAVAPKLTMVGLNPIIDSAPWGYLSWPRNRRLLSQIWIKRLMRWSVSAYAPSTSRADIRVERRKTCVRGANISDQADP